MTDKPKVWKRSDITDRMVCEASKQYHSHGTTGGPMITEILMQSGAPLKVVEAALNRAIERGLIEYGVSARTGWLTPEGEAFMNTELTSEEKYVLEVRAAIKRTLIFLEEELSHFMQTTHGSFHYHGGDLELVTEELLKVGKAPDPFNISELSQRIGGLLKSYELEEESL